MLIVPTAVHSISSESPRLDATYESEGESLTPWLIIALIAANLVSFTLRAVDAWSSLPLAALFLVVWAIWKNSRGLPSIGRFSAEKVEDRTCRYRFTWTAYGALASVRFISPYAEERFTPAAEGRFVCDVPSGGIVRLVVRAKWLPYITRTATIRFPLTATRQEDNP